DQGGSLRRGGLLLAGLRLLPAGCAAVLLPFGPDSRAARLELSTDRDALLGRPKVGPVCSHEPHRDGLRDDDDRPRVGGSGHRARRLTRLTRTHLSAFIAKTSRT